MKANKVTIERADNGFILKFDSIGGFKDAVDPAKTELYLDQDKLFGRCSELFLREKTLCQQPIGEGFYEEDED